MENEKANLLQVLGWKLVPNPDHGFCYDVVDSDGVIVPEAEYKRYLDAETLAAPFDGQKRICGVGDSWIDILYPLSAILGYPPCFFDYIEGSGKYRTLELGDPGLTLRNILKESPRRYMQPMKSAMYDYFILSASGNDVAGVPFANMLKTKASGNGSTNGRDYIKPDIKDHYLGNIYRGYTRITQEVWIWSSGRTECLIHGYDIPAPRVQGPFFGRFLSEMGFDVRGDAELIESIMSYLIGELYSTLESVRDLNADRRIRVVDLRGIVDGRWHDELHPDRDAAKDVADKFMGVINSRAVS